MVKHHCCAFNCTNSTQKQKNFAKYPELANVRFFPFPQDNANKYYAAGMSERERRMRWIAACRLDSLNVTRHTRICSVHFEGGLGPTKLNPVPSIFAFPQHLQRKPLKSRTDPEERRGKQQKETPQTSKKNKLFTTRRKQGVKPEQMDHESKEEYSAFEGANTPYCEPVYVDAEVQTELTASDIELMADCKEKLDNKTQLKRDLFMEDICKNDQAVRFYTGIPSLACLFMVFNFLQPIAEKMKYWDGKKKTEKEAYQVGECCFHIGAQTNSS